MLLQEAGGLADLAGAPPKSIAIVSDAWYPQMNGVVRTLTTTCDILRQNGLQVDVITPDQYPSVPCPTYPEIRLALTMPGSVGRRLAKLQPDAVHIATEGPLGLAARRYCMSKSVPFTTAYHTQFPDYVSRRTYLPPEAFWPYIRWFHRPAQRVMVATESIREELRAQGLTRLHHWGRGVDLALFRPDVGECHDYEGLARPIQLYVGRVAVEKNLEAFLKTNQPGTKVIVGDGPARGDLESRYPDAVFLGKRGGEDLARCYADADVFVFPSKTDTFGLVMIEALACGTPVAAYPVPGPRDILTDEVGAMSDDLDEAIAAALTRDRQACARFGEDFSWEAATAQFLAGLEEFDGITLTP
tara:strand:+ start:2910 stop:3983 length:1074 start_codon:yes stop_codon:yes gene_type:complete